MISKLITEYHFKNTRLALAVCHDLADEVRALDNQLMDSWAQIIGCDPVSAEETQQLLEFYLEKIAELDGSSNISKQARARVQDLLLAKHEWANDNALVA